MTHQRNTVDDAYDAALAAAARSGDEAAALQLVERYRPSVLASMRRMRSVEDAEHVATLRLLELVYAPVYKPIRHVVRLELHNAERAARREQYRNGNRSWTDPESTEEPPVNTTPVVDQLLGVLEPDELALVDSLFGLTNGAEMQLEDAAAELNISTKSARELKASALRKMSAAATEKGMQR